MYHIISYVSYNIIYIYMHKLNNMIIIHLMIVYINIYEVYIYIRRGCDPKPTFTVLNHGNNHRYR